MGRGTQVVRERSAKPLCVGSIPTRASSFLDRFGKPEVLRSAQVTRKWTVGSKVGKRGQMAALNFCGFLHPARMVRDILQNLSPMARQLSCLCCPRRCH